MYSTPRLKTDTTTAPVISFFLIFYVQKNSCKCEVAHIVIVDCSVESNKELFLLWPYIWISDSDISSVERFEGIITTKTNRIGANEYYEKSCPQLLREREIYTCIKNL